jgi:hypothetical protein
MITKRRYLNQGIAKKKFKTLKNPKFMKFFKNIKKTYH